MPYLDVFVGDLEGPRFSWEGGDWNGNCPPPTGPALPNSLFSRLVGAIEQGELDGKQTDWGCWAARMTGAEIEAVLLKWNCSEDVLQKVRSLESNKLYALAAREF